MNDVDLIRAIQGGDSASLTILYQRYVKGVWRYLDTHLLRKRQATEDLVSETFIAAIRTIHTFDPKQGTVYGWLLGIARNKLRDHLRKAHRAADCEPADVNVVADPLSADPGQALMAAEAKAAVIRTLDALEDEERLALEWKYVEKLSVREIAQRLGRSEKAVEAILYRARASFRTVFAREQMRVT
jgi:RNA polymerase sigma-70 factor (ECF subfamily)